MALRITDSSLLEKRYLEVASDGVIFYEATLLSGKRRFRYDEVENILMSPEGKLSFQVRQEVFSIATNRGNQKHEEVIASFVNEVKRAAGVVMTE